MGRSEFQRTPFGLLFGWPSRTPARITALDISSVRWKRLLVRETFWPITADGIAPCARTVRPRGVVWLRGIARGGTRVAILRTTRISALAFSAVRVSYVLFSSRRCCGRCGRCGERARSCSAFLAQWPRAVPVPNQQG
jgi:hypothetical protein